MDNIKKMPKPQRNTAYKNLFKYYLRTDEKDSLDKLTGIDPQEYMGTHDLTLSGLMDHINRFNENRNRRVLLIVYTCRGEH